MRAFAVLAVFADHLFGWPHGGFVGVDVFFVLSGFFISRLLIRERKYTRKLSFQRFYTRRVKRILPSALLVLVVTVIGAQLLFPATRAKDTLLDALYAAVFAANFRFEAVGADYFQQGLPPSPIQHYWSLSIEEQFYFVWPLLLVLIFAATHTLRRRGHRWARQWGLFGSMALVVAASFAWAMHLSTVDPNSAYFSTFTRVWELGVGALLAIAGPWLDRIPDKARPAIAYAGLGGAVLSLFVIGPTSQFPAPWAALPVLSTALVVASFDGGEVRGMQVLTNPVARWFGDVSYTLYLWHWPVIILMLTVLPKGPLFYVIALVVALGLTAITYRFYEDPIRKAKWPESTRKRNREAHPSRLAAAGLVAAMVVVVAIIGIQRDTTMKAAADNYLPANIETNEQVDLCFGAPALITDGCPPRNPNVPLTPGIDTAAQDIRGQYQCFHFEGDTKFEPCTYGYRGPDATRIALVGDSHAAMMLPALWPVLQKNKWELTTFIGNGCQWRNTPLQGCPMGDIQPQLLSKPYDLVLTTSLRDWGGDPDDFQPLWEQVQKAGSRIAVVADGPSVSQESIDCLTRIGNDQTTCFTSHDQGYAKPDPLLAVAERVPGTNVIDLGQYFCTADKCPSVIGNVVVYRDTKGHITATFARTLAKAIDDEVQKVLAPPVH
jgi:peptidoglycan/LPS O-acetylase OafA/YrhL